MQYISYAKASLLFIGIEKYFPATRSEQADKQLYNFQHNTSTKASIQHSPSIKNQADTKSKGHDFKPLPLMNAHHNTKTKLCPCITLGDIKLGCYTLYENSRNYNLKSFISSKLVSFYFLDKLCTFWTSPHTYERWKTKVWESCWFNKHTSRYTALIWKKIKTIIKPVVKLKHANQ